MKAKKVGARTVGQGTKQRVPRFMQPGSMGTDVAILQTFLRGRFGKSVLLDKHGIYGPKTLDAVRKLQSELGLEQDGYFGPATRRTLQEMFDFHFNATCRAVSGVTLFFQPDGTAKLFSTI